MPTVYKSKYWGKAKHRSQIAVRGHVCWDSYAMRSAAWKDTLKCVGKKTPSDRFQDSCWELSDTL